MSEALIDIRPDHLAIVRNILQRRVPHHEVWAFGSRVRWTAKQYSDLDLAIIGDSPLPVETLSQLTSDFAESDLPWRVDIVDWSTTSTAFRTIIEQERVVVQAGSARRLGEWGKSKLGEVIELKRGYDLPQRDRVSGTVPIISSSGISDFHDKAMAKAPGVVTGRYGTIGQVFYIEEDYWPLNTALYVRDFKGNDPKFISYFLRTIDFQVYSDKAAVPGLNRNHLHEAQVRVPPLAEQRAIAHVLGSLDDKIDLNRRTNETLEAMARALFKDWFVDFGPVRAKMQGRQPPGLSADIAALFPAALDAEGKPEGWESQFISEIVAFNPNERLNKDEVAPYLDMAALPTQGSWSQQPIDRSFTSGMKFRNRDTLMARITPCLENGKTAFIQNLKEGQTAWGSTEFIILRPKGKVPAEYCYLLARSKSFREHAIQSMTGTSGRQRVQSESLAKYVVTVPDDSIWDAFSTIVHPLFKSIAVNAELSETLSKLRDLLLPKLLSGEIHIADAEHMVSSAC